MAVSRLTVAQSILDLASKKLLDDTLTVDSLAAAGTTQATATPMVANSAVVSGANGTAGILLPPSELGTLVSVHNTVLTAGSNLLVYPRSGDQINSLGANVALSLQPGCLVDIRVTTPGQWQVSTQAASVGSNLKQQVAPPAKTVSVTLTTAEVLSGIVTGAQGGGAAATYTFPLGTALETALLALYPHLSVNDSFDLSVINTSVVAAETITIAGNTGVTLVGKGLIPAIAAGVSDSSGLFRVRRTAANTYVIYRIG